VVKPLIKKALKTLGYRIVREQELSLLIPEISAAQLRILEAGGRHSMTGPIRMWTLIQAIEDVRRRGVKGDFVECGVWKGGNLIVAGLMRAALGSPEQIWGFDTFQGMSEPTSRDRKTGDTKDAQAKFEKLARDGHNEWCFSPIDEVRRNFERECGNLNVKLVPGKVEDTLRDPANVPQSIAILRLDTDWYESTKIELEILYPRLAPGGILIIDDYGEWAGARQAVDEYFAGREPWLHYVDRSCRLLVK
jgi:hypothetical protein